MRQCERCGAGFEPKFLGKSNEQRFCTDRCNRLAKADRTYRRKQKQRIAALNCRHCGAAITGRVKQFCNSKCRSDWNNKHQPVVLITRSCQCCYGIFVIDKRYRDRYCSQFCRGFMQEVWPRPVKRQKDDPHPLGLTCDGCSLPLWAQGKCAKHYAALRMAMGKRPRYQYTCEVCHCPGESWDSPARMHRWCSARSTQKTLIMSRSTEIAIWIDPKPQRPLVNVLAPGQKLFAGTCWNCGAQWVSYEFRHTCSDECSKMLKKAKMARSGGGHRKRARHYGGEWQRGITPLSIFEASRWTCQLCLGPVDPREATGLWMPTLDHIVPMARGGGHIRENLQLAHMICNAYKRDL